MYSDFWKKIATADQVRELTLIEENVDDVKIEPLIRVDYITYILPEFESKFWEEFESRVIEAGTNKNAPLDENDTKLLQTLRLILSWRVYADSVTHGYISATSAGTLSRIPFDTAQIDQDDVDSLAQAIHIVAQQMMSQLKVWFDKNYTDTHEHDDNTFKCVRGKNGSASIGGVYFPG